MRAAQRGVCTARYRAPRRWCWTSRTTVGNTLHAARLLDSRPWSDGRDVLLVSSEFHLPRARYFFEAVFAQAGLASRIAARPAPTPETLAQRIAGELRFAAELDAQLEKHFGLERETLAAAGGELGHTHFDRLRLRVQPPILRYIGSGTCSRP